MGKKSRLKRQRREGVPGDHSLMWNSEEGIHALGAGQPPTAAELAQMTASYQERIRNSPLSEQMVREFGEQKATEMLKQFTVRISSAEKRTVTAVSSRSPDSGADPSLRR